MTLAILPSATQVPMQSYFIDSSQFEIVRICGPDASRFLQGQVTCDVVAVADGEFIYGAACNNKGRVIAPFLLHREDQDFLLIFRSGLAEKFISALRRFLPFYKCSMRQDEQLGCIGLGGDTLPDLLPAQGWPSPNSGTTAHLQSGWIARLAGETPQFIVCSKTSTLDAIKHMIDGTLLHESGAYWDACCIRNGQFPFTPADSEQYTPQELNYEQRYVSFTKGCYTGQEIVARMHYRGKIKKQFQRVEFDAPDAAASEHVSLLNSEGGLLAECIKAVHLPEGRIVALALLPVDASSQSNGFPTSTGSIANVYPF